MALNIKRLGQNVKADGNIISDCNGISFVNQGDSQAAIFCGDSKGSRILLPNESVSYSNENPEAIEVTLFRVVFTGGAGADGIGDIYVEREYKKIC